jgi:hypothetical protein
LLVKCAKRSIGYDDAIHLAMRILGSIICSEMESRIAFTWCWLCFLQKGRRTW